MDRAKYNGMNGEKYVHVPNEKLKLQMSVQKLNCICLFKNLFLREKQSTDELASK